MHMTGMESPLLSLGLEDGPPHPSLPSQGLHSANRREVFVSWRSWASDKETAMVEDPARWAFVCLPCPRFARVAPDGARAAPSRGVLKAMHVPAPETCCITSLVVRLRQRDRAS
jgi:hypothetical protein